MVVVEEEGGKTFFFGSGRRGREGERARVLVAEEEGGKRELFMMVG